MRFRNEDQAKSFRISALLGELVAHDMVGKKNEAYPRSPVWAGVGKNRKWDCNVCKKKLAYHNPEAIIKHFRKRHENELTFAAMMKPPK
jgi:hypothetical protein